MSFMEITGAVETAEMLTSIGEQFGQDAAWVVGVGANYGVYVEFGTSKMAAQPYLLPATRTVMRSDFGQIEAQAESTGQVVEEIALRIEREAKDRAPVDTGNLRASIEAAPR